jgi:cytochrome c553
MRSRTAWILVAGLLSLLHETGPSRASATERLSQATLNRIWAITPDADHGKILYLKHCTACHGRHAWGDGYQETPALAGQREQYFVLQLTQLAIGKRDGQSMHQTLQKPDLTGHRPYEI